MDINKKKIQFKEKVGKMAELFRTGPGTENTKNELNFGKTTFFAPLSSSAELSSEFSTTTTATRNTLEKI